MKKLSVLLASLIILLCGCSGSDVPEIDEYLWTMSTVQSADANGQAIAIGPDGSSTLDTAVELELTCQAASGKLTFTDKTNNQTYTGTYKRTDTDSQSVIYEVTVGSSDGTAVVSMTTYQDGSQTPTLIISLADYTLNFFRLVE